jgi:hypothetical protein
VRGCVGGLEVEAGVGVGLGVIGALVMGAEVVVGVVMMGFDGVAVVVVVWRGGSRVVWLFKFEGMMPAPPVAFPACPPSPTKAVSE